MAGRNPLRSEVVQLYKNLLYMGREYPAGYEYFRGKCRAVFRKNSAETDPDKIEKMVQHGQFITKELEALYMLRKYRTLKKRYYDKEDLNNRILSFEQTVDSTPSKTNN